MSQTKRVTEVKGELELTFINEKACKEFFGLKTNLQPDGYLRPSEVAYLYGQDDPEYPTEDDFWAYFDDIIRAQRRSEELKRTNHPGGSAVGFGPYLYVLPDGTWVECRPCLF
jgi:hypothetical protein